MMPENNPNKYQHNYGAWRMEEDGGSRKGDVVREEAGSSRSGPKEK